MKPPKLWDTSPTSGPEKNVLKVDFSTQKKNEITIWHKFMGCKYETWNRGSKLSWYMSDNFAGKGWQFSYLFFHTFSWWHVLNWFSFYQIFTFRKRHSCSKGVKGSVPSPKQGLKRLVSRTGPSAKLSPSLQPSDSAIWSGDNTSCNKVLPLPTAQIGQQHQQYMSDYCMNGKEVLGDRLSTTYHLPEPSPPWFELCHPQP